MDFETCGGGGASGSVMAAALNFFAMSQCLLNENWPPQALVHNGSNYDFIVVGGGTAGAVMAARLSELPHVTVLLLEAGGDPPQDSIIPGFHNVLKASKYDWNFTTVNDHFSSQALNGGRQNQPRGKVLGGSGSINDMIYSRGFPQDYDEWAELVGDQWNWETVLKYFKKTERLTDERFMNDPEYNIYHGFDGEMEVTGFNESTNTIDRYTEAFQELGLQLIKDMTSPNGIGVGRFSHTIRSGKRESTATALLNKAAQRDNLFVLKEAFVTKVLIENDTAYGVNVLLNDEEFTFFANKEVIVSAGTFNTAKLLMLSGLGPRSHLESIGAEVIKDLPIGDNLHDHVMVLTYIAADKGTCSTEINSKHMNAIMYLYNHSGFYSKSSDMGAYFSFSGNNSVPDFAVYPTCMSVNSDFMDGCTQVLGFRQYICDKLVSVNRHKELLSLAVVNLKPKSRGYVRIKSLNPLDDPVIFSGTFSDLDDLVRFPEAINMAWGIINTTYFKEKNAYVIDLEIEQCKDFHMWQRMKCVARALATSAWHAVGTAAMGSVVDAELRVKGIAGLRVVDASVMPMVVRGNTNAPVVMIAERAADFIKQSNDN